MWVTNFRVNLLLFIRIIIVMEKPFLPLYVSLKEALRSQDHALTGIDRYARGIELIRETISQVGSLGVKQIRGRETEITYFRNVWPIFYGKLFLYIQLYHFELRRLSLPSRVRQVLIQREEKRVAAFFRANREFWMYYGSGSAVLDEQFTRKQSQSRIFDPLALVIDQEGTTLGSLKAARCLAMEAYRDWLVQEQERGKEILEPGAGKDYTWGSADADFVEWLYGIQSVGAIKYKGEPADMSRLQKWAKSALGKEVVNIYDRFKVLRNRKKDRVPFSKRMTNALERTMDEKDGKFE